MDLDSKKMMGKVKANIFDVIIKEKLICNDSMIYYDYGDSDERGFRGQEGGQDRPEGGKHDEAARAERRNFDVVHHHYH